MAGYVLSCCSTADITVEHLRRRGIAYVYFNYELDGVPCKDDCWQSRSPRELYDAMLAGAEAKTSQVSTGDYVEHFSRILEQGKDVLHVTLSSGISGTVNSACAARDQLEGRYPGRRVVVVDSLCAASGYGLMMDQLADLRDEGLSLDEVATWCCEHRQELQHWFFSSDLTFFVRGGRISKAAGLVGGALKLCPLMDVDPAGALRVVEKIRTKNKASKRMVEVMTQLARDGVDYDGKVYICQSVCEEDARHVADLIEETFPKMNGVAEINDIGATIGTHTGPGTVALFYWGKPRA